MQTKRITGTLVLCLVLSYFAGCQAHHGSIADEETLTKKTLEVRIASEDISVKAADPELEKGESLNCLACFGDHIYYLAEHEVITDDAQFFADYYRIGSVDVETGKSTYLVKLEDKEGLFINELVAFENKLFYQVIKKDKRYIECCSLENGHRHVVFETDREGISIFSGDGTYLVWYDQADDMSVLYALDANDEKIRKIADNVFYRGAYTRPFISEGIVSWVDNDNQIVVFDLAKNEELFRTKNLEEFGEIQRLKANTEYVVFTSSYDYDAKMFALRYQSNEVYELKHDENVSRFDYLLLGDRAVLVSHRYPWSWILIDLESGEAQSVITNGPAMLSAVSSDGLLYGAVFSVMHDGNPKIIYFTENR